MKTGGHLSVALTAVVASILIITGVSIIRDVGHTSFASHGQWFRTFDVPSGTDPIADIANDTIQFLVTGTDISLTGSVVNDTITLDLLANAGTDITADLEEEAHTTEHQENAADEILGEGLGTACSDGQILEANATGGLDCVTPSSGVSTPGHLGIITNRYTVPGWYGANPGTTLANAEFMWFIPIFVSQDTTYDRIGIDVSSSQVSTDVRLCIYNWDNGVPGTLVLDAGTVDATSTGGKEITISQTLTQGFYFLAAIAGVNGPTLRGFDTANAIQTPVEGISTALVNDMPSKVVLYKSGQATERTGGCSSTAITPDLSISAGHGGFVKLREQ